MLKFRLETPFVLAGLLLAGCSGSSNGTGTATVVGATTPAPTPTPAPAPAPSPTPTPTPTPGATSYTPFASLTGDQRYASVCADYRRDTLVPVPIASPFPFEINGRISYAAATQSYTVNNPNYVSQLFGPADLVANPPSNTTGYSRTTSFGETQTFQIARPAPAGVPLVYARTAASSVRVTSFSQRVDSLCVIGVPTRPTDVPAAQVVNFTRFAVAGMAFDSRSGTEIAYRLSNSIASLSVDLTSGAVVTAIRFIGTPVAGGPDVELGTFTALATITPDTAGFFGSDAALTPPLNGPPFQVQGGFFGPQGAEFGYSFGLNRGTTAAPSTYNLAIVGTVVGAR